jgi:hypothetical protein
MVRRYSAVAEPTARRPVLILNPRADRQFVAASEALVSGGVASPAELQARLRERWANAAVQPRSLSGEPTLMWYVYRDGRWTRESSLPADRH